MKSIKWTIPNLLSVFRIIASPLLLLLGWFNMPVLFLILLGLMLFSDALDGMIARLFHQTTEVGARLDSVGDLLTYLSIPLPVWWLWPEIILAQSTYLIASLIFYLIPSIFAFIKFRKLASYHTWITKISAVLMSVGIFLLLLFKNDMIFHLAVYTLFVAMLENVAITLIISKQKSNVRSVWDVWKKSS